MSAKDGSIHRVGEIITGDISMSAKILQIVNSSFFGMPRKIDSISEAVSYLGFDLIRSLVLGNKIFSSFSSDNIAGLSMQRIWQSGNKVSLVAKKLAGECELNVQSYSASVLAGMLQNLGILVMANGLPDKYRQVIALDPQEFGSLCSRERAIFGHSHAEVGAFLLTLWGLPVEIVDAVAFHHNPSASSAAETLNSLAVVYIANLLVAESNFCFGETENTDYDYLDKIGVTEKFVLWRKRYSETE
jgi:HD-like signal output (HDOD) protein